MKIGWILIVRVAWGGKTNRVSQFIIKSLRKSTTSRCWGFLNPLGTLQKSSKTSTISCSRGMRNSKYYILIRKQSFDYCRKKEEVEFVGEDKIKDSWEDEGIYPIIEVSSGWFDIPTWIPFLSPKTRNFNCRSSWVRSRQNFEYPRPFFIGLRRIKRNLCSES